mmetsp:Transcript_32775/g.83208  ORF Transcript_32775/g.83208 Transcript_32775/m.83208 type:complete len:211 (+) Transcript_32775:259-891(+)
MQPPPRRPGLQASLSTSTTCPRWALGGWPSGCPFFRAAAPAAPQKACQDPLWVQFKPSRVLAPSLRSLRSRPSPRPAGAPRAPPRAAARSCSCRPPGAAPQRRTSRRRPCRRRSPQACACPPSRAACTPARTRPSRPRTRARPRRSGGLAGPPRASPARAVTPGTRPPTGWTACPRTAWPRRGRRWSEQVQLSSASPYRLHIQACSTANP